MLSFVARGWIGVGSCKVSFGKYCILADRARLLSYTEYTEYQSRFATPCPLFDLYNSFSIFKHKQKNHTICMGDVPKS